MMSAAEILQNDYQIDSEIWSVTSFNELRKDGMEVERYNLLNPDKDQKISYVEQCLGKTEGPIMAASDYMRMHSDQIRPYTNKSFYSLGTDGFGRSDTRKKLRKFRCSLAESNEENHKLLTTSNDFFSLSTLRDLIFHVQEHRFTFLEIKNCLDELEMVVPFVLALRIVHWP